MTSGLNHIYRQYSVDNFTGDITIIDNTINIDALLKNKKPLLLSAKLRAENSSLNILVDYELSTILSYYYDEQSTVNGYSGMVVAPNITFIISIVKEGSNTVFRVETLAT